MDKPVYQKYLKADELQYLIDTISAKFLRSNDEGKEQHLVLSSESYYDFAPFLRNAIVEKDLKIYDVTDGILFEMSLISKALKDSDALLTMSKVYTWAKHAQSKKQQLNIKAVTLPTHSMIWESTREENVYCEATPEERDAAARKMIEANHEVENCNYKIESAKFSLKTAKDEFNIATSMLNDVAETTSDIFEIGILKPVECKYIVDKLNSKTTIIRMDTQEIIEVRAATQKEWESLEFPDGGVAFDPKVEVTLQYASESEERTAEQLED